jgi:hypothetical protein
LVFIEVDLSQLGVPCLSANAPPPLVGQEADSKSGDDDERGNQSMVKYSPTVKCRNRRVAKPSHNSSAKSGHERAALRHRCVFVRSFDSKGFTSTLFHDAQ